MKFDAADTAAMVSTFAGNDVVNIAGESITAMFREPFQLVQLAGRDYEGKQPQIVVTDVALAALISEVDHGTPVTVNGASYTVTGIDEDGAGFTILLLKEA